MNTRTILSRTTPMALSVLLLALLVTYAPQAHASFTCELERDLDIGIEGDDVLCLQKFLNGAGFTLTDTGAGSPGSETNRFGGLTRDALARWQTEHDVYPASGYLGKITRAALKALSGVVEDLDDDSDDDDSNASGALGSLEGVLSSLSDADRTQANELLALLTSLGI